VVAFPPSVLTRRVRLCSCRARPLPIRAPVDLPDDRDQLTTRSDPRFTELRTHLYAQIQQAKQGGDQGQAPSAGLAARRARGG
jgi:NitT/TauT family transport system ATP-binding protein